VFLKLNGARPAPDSEEWEALIMDVASGALSRAETAKRLRAQVGAQAE